MKITEIRDPERWNALLEGFSYASSLQSWGWGEVKRLSGWTPRRLLLEEDEKPLLALQVLAKGRGPLRLLYAPRGPAFDDWGALSRALTVLKKQLKGLSLKLEPPLAIPAEAVPPEAPGLVPAETIQPEYSLQVPLDDEEAILKRMKPKTRYNIRLSARKGVTTRIVHPGDPDAENAFNAFFMLFSETNARAKLLQHSRAYYEAVFKELDGHGAEAFISLAEHEGEPLAAGLFIAFKDRVDYLYGGSTRKKRNLMAPYAMHWAAIRHGLAKGRRYYDLWGVPRVLREDSHAWGIYRFKEGFGGERVRFPAYELLLSPLAPFVNRALRLRKTLINLKARGTARDVL